MVQIEQLIPGWWESAETLAQQLGTDRYTIGRCIRNMERYGYIKRHSVSNRSGLWIWWIKRHQEDQPRPEDEPAWVLRSITARRERIRIPISQRTAWAKSRNIAVSTMCNFLNGRQPRLARRWELVSSPLDLEVEE